jgi:biopolymer transport protein ExbB
MSFVLRPNGARGAAIVLLALFTIGFVTSTWQSARAQDEAAPEAEVVADKKPARNLFTHMVRSAGIVFGPLLLATSIALVALIVLLAIDLQMTKAIPTAFVEEFAETVNKGHLRDAFELTKNNTSFLGRVLFAGMGRLKYGIEDAREVSVNTVESIKATKEQLIAYLAIIGTLGPLIGLVGTVYGMIKAFMELSYGGTPRVDKLADAISEALVITLLGVALSVPAIFCHAFFRNRLIRMSMDTANLADDLLTQMYHNSRQAGPLPAAVATTTPPTAPVAGKPVQPESVNPR